MEARPSAGDTPELRKRRGAFFTPFPIADFLVAWALAGRRDATLLDPTCGAGVFLQAAARRLASKGATSAGIREQLFGVDLHSESLAEARRLLGTDEHEATLLCGDFFNEPTPAQLGARLPWMDAVVGNPPFVRYHEHRGSVRARSAEAALAQGVRLSGLASSWAALLVHACAFLKPEGRVAMVLPAELLTVGYAEPVRQWLRRRFQAVHLVFFKELQFADVEEQVVLLVARGRGGCDAFALHEVRDAEELQHLHAFDGTAVAPQPSGKWTDLLLPGERRQLFRQVASAHYAPLSGYGQPELGTVTGANKYFALSEATRLRYDIALRHVTPIVPPGTRHLRGTRFTRGRWEQLRLEGYRVWLLNPSVKKPSGGLARYISYGKELGVHKAYKCSVREPWWKPPVVASPDLFFTYMSHRSPRLIRNDAGVSLLNSMHGLAIKSGASELAREALPLLAFNSVTMLGAEIYGRSYGGGILKMEPREAAELPVPRPEIVARVWTLLEPLQAKLNELVRAGDWRTVVREVDDLLLCRTVGLSSSEATSLREAAAVLRSRRTRRED